MRLPIGVAGVVVFVITAGAQQVDPDKVFALQGQPQQETTNSPVTLTFDRAQVTIQPSDVNQLLTIRARELAKSEPSKIFVLNIVKRRYQETTSSPWTFTLASGAVITVPASAVNDMLTSDLRQALRASPASLVDAKAKCAREWPDHFRMRAYCEERQKEGADSLARRSMTSADERTIRAKCEKDWPDDFRMRNCCEKEQLKALRSIR
jgi:hypothetical protein